MTRPTFNLTLRDRNLIRLEANESIESFHAQNLATNGYVTLFEMEADFDSGQFPYPFGNVGTHRIYTLNISDKGRDRLTQLYHNDNKNYEAYQTQSIKFHTPYLNHSRDQILYTQQGVVQMLNDGNRDHLFVFNQKDENPDFSILWGRSIDPDTLEQLMSEDEILGLDKDCDDDSFLDTLVKKIKSARPNL